MKITCNSDALNKAIQIVQKAIVSKPSTPIFSGIHILTLEDKIELQAMDLNMAISCTTDAQILEPGEIVVSAKYLSELIRKFSGEEITIEKNIATKNITITSSASEFKLLLMSEEDFPKFPLFDGDKSIEISDDKIKDLIRKTIYACSTDESRPLFTGILFDVNSDNITCVGTNTHRLAIKSIAQENAEPISLIIPAKVLAEIARNLNSDVPQTVKISLLKNQIMVVIENVIIVSRLIEGKFPDYRRVIPAKFAVTAKVKVKELAGAVERVSLFSSDGEYSIIKFNINGNVMTLTSSNPASGTGREIVNCESEGDNLNVAFNSQYVMDILKNMESEEVIFSLNTSLSPVCVKALGDDSYTYIVTPVRVVF